MAKIFGILLIVVGVWIGLEIYTNGMDEAFGGVFASFGEPRKPGEPKGSIPQRVGTKVQSEVNDAMERRMGDEEDTD